MTDPNEAAPAQKPSAVRRRRVRGQAMLEYSMLNWVLVCGLMLGATVKMFPGSGRQRENVIRLFFNAYQIYYDSFYFVLNLPFP